MASSYDTLSPANTQAPPVVSELEAIFRELPDEALLEKLRGPKRRGRPGYDPSVLWRCYLVRYVLGLPSISDLIRTLHDSPFICQACGIASPEEIPSRPTMSRFMAKLAWPMYSIMVKNIMRGMARRCFETLPGFGKSVALDSTDVKAWANRAKKPCADPDASWAVKSTSGNLKKFWLGYKAHIAVDTDYELPIAMTVTSANVHDVKAVKPLLRQCRVALGKFGPDYIMADPGYSSDELRTHIHRQYGAEPIIKANPAHKKAAARETLEFKLLYNQRVAVERVFSRLKEHRGFNNVRVRRLAKVTIHCFLSLIVLQAQALATSSRISVRKVA